MAPSARCVSIDTAAQGRAGERQGGCSEDVPVRVVVVARRRRRFEREPRPVQADQAIGELVLDRLELTDELAELLSDLGVIDSELERTFRRAERTAGTAKPRHQRDVRKGFARNGQPHGRRVLEAEFAEWRHGEAGRDLHRQSRSAAGNHRNAGVSVKIKKCVADCPPSMNAALPESASPRVSTRPAAGSPSN